MLYNSYGKHTYPRFFPFALYLFPYVPCAKYSNKERKNVSRSIKTLVTDLKLTWGGEKKNILEHSRPFSLGVNFTMEFAFFKRHSRLNYVNVEKKLLMKAKQCLLRGLNELSPTTKAFSKLVSMKKVHRNSFKVFFSIIPFSRVVFTIKSFQRWFSTKWVNKFKVN